MRTLFNKLIPSVNGIAVVCVMIAFFAVPCRSDQIILSSGETLTCQVTARTEDTLTIQHPVLGQLTIASSNVTVIVTEAKSAETDPDQSQETYTSVSSATPPAALEAKKISFFDGWESRLETGLSGTNGNSETSNVRFSFKTKKETDFNRWTFNTVYYYATSDGTTTRNALNAELNHDWLFADSTWFMFAKGIYDYDEFQAWDHRLSGFAGVGYALIQTERLESEARLGGGMTKEFGSANELRPEGLLAASLIKWHITDSQTLSASGTFLPDLGEIREFRIIGKLEWQLAIDQADGMSILFGIEDEYESETNGDAVHNDLKYYGALVFDF